MSKSQLCYVQHVINSSCMAPILKMEIVHDNYLKVDHNVHLFAMFLERYDKAQESYQNAMSTKKLFYVQFIEILVDIE